MNYEVQGQRGILVKLETYEQPKSGLINPLYVQGVTDGGKPMSQLDEFELSPIGTIVQISKTAQRLMDDMDMEYAVGDRVTVSKNMVHSSNYFYIKKGQKVVQIMDEDERHILISPVMLEAKIVED